ncbi:hypothetical protein [Nocardia xishanensis]
MATGTLPERLLMPTNLTPPTVVTAAAGLAELARDLEFDGHPEHAARARAIMAHLGYEAVAVDQLHADVTMIAAYGPGVGAGALSTGAQLLEAVGE